VTKEQQIEEALIAKLRDLKYTYRPDIRDKASLEQNFRDKFERHNLVTLTDSEFARLKNEIITSDVFTSAKRLRERQAFEREDGTPMDYTLVNNKDWCKNDFEVINQLRINTENSHHRYDVIILMNGLPVVQIELKSHQIVTRRAMEQIVNYKNDPGNGYTNSLMCFMQLFIVSNENRTYYFANNQNQHFTFNADERFLPIYQLADKDNKKIHNLKDFSDNFLAKCTLGQMIGRYMVLVQSEQKLMIMRPYQIYAVQAIVDCIKENRGNGYIWHTTGSGKTLTSFKASTLLKNNEDIHKVVFVVDRKDLDRQTREEFNKFQNKCVEENTNTEALVRRLLSDSKKDKVIVTTIQKLGLALDETSEKSKQQQEQGKLTYKQRLEHLRDKRMVFIFDECHRSQFGENHGAIKTFFNNHQLFGFTGTPIFDENSSFKRIDGTTAYNVTTLDVFEKPLHEYTITNAIHDRNVLSFHIDYFGKETKTITDGNEETDNKQKKKPTKETPPPEAVVKAILDKHDQATDYRRFNSIFATSKIDSAIEYVKLFEEQQVRRLAENEDYRPLNIACVFSPPAQTLAKDKDGNVKNVKDIKQLQDDLKQEQEDNKNNPEEKKAALINVISGYNKQYRTNHTINEFDLYYQDVQQRIKDHKYPDADLPRGHKDKIDIIIVVDMLLTGFDSKYLNTLYVDKNLKYHGLIQAFSRTNRVLNDTKPHGNILDFRFQEDEVDTAIAKFSGSGEEANKEVWLVDPAPVVVEQFKEAVDELESFMVNHGLTATPDQVPNLKGETAKIDFVSHFKKVQKLKTKLDQYTDLSEDDVNAINRLMPIDKQRGFKGAYLETALELKPLQKKSNGEVSQELQQLDLELVLFGSALIDYDYIMALISRSTMTTSTRKKTVTREEVIDIIKSNANIMDDHEAMLAYVDSLPVGQQNEDDIRNGYIAFKAKLAKENLQKIANNHSLEPEAVQAFIDNIMERMIFDAGLLTDLLAPLELGWKARRTAELALMEQLGPYLYKLAEGREISGLEVDE